MCGNLNGRCGGARGAVLPNSAECRSFPPAPWRGQPMGRAAGGVCFVKVKGAITPG